MPATSPNYDLIQTWIEPTPRTFTAEGYIKDGVDDEEPRTLCPHVLGYKKAGSPHEIPANERVLCWQLAGPGDNPEWRCYKVKDLVDIAVDMATPWEMGMDYSKHQNCTKVEKFKVPFPP